MTRRVRLDLAYDGTAFSGWQVQPGLRTVQGVIEDALKRLHGGSPVRIRGAGRTDAGVHARGQVADALVDDRLAGAEIERALSGILPEDVRVIRVATVPDGFHARHDAIAKTYAYRLDRSRHGDPFLMRFALHVPYPLDESAIDAALALLPGTRDWSGFTGAACEIEDRVRTMTDARRVGGDADRTDLVFTADGFLTHMVRNLAGTVLEIGRGAMPVERVMEILESRDRTRAGPTAAAKGRVLERVTYGAASRTYRAGGAPESV